MAASWQTRRTIPPILDDPRAASLTLPQRHTLLLLPLAVDDHGRALDDAGRLNGLLWGLLWREHGPEAMEADLAALASAGFLTRYSVDGVSYLQVRGWDADQVISRRAPSKYPAPPTEPGASGSFGAGWGFSGGDGEKVNAKVKAAVDSFVAQAQHAAERLQDPAVQSNAADYLAKLASQVDPTWGEKVRTRADHWIKNEPATGGSAPSAGADSAASTESGSTATGTTTTEAPTATGYPSSTRYPSTTEPTDVTPPAPTFSEPSNPGPDSPSHGTPPHHTPQD